MKKSTQKNLIFLLLVLIIPNLLFIKVNAITVGDTSVGAEVGDIYTYVVTEADETYSSARVGDKLEITIDSISNLYLGVPNGYLNVNITMRSYNKISDTWTVDPKVYNTLSYNATLETANRVEVYRSYILPTPLNVTLMSSIIDGMMMTISTPVGVNGINMSNTIMFPPIVYTYIYNSEGIAISRTRTQGSDFYETYVLDTTTDLPGPSIPFGMYFLIFTVITLFALVIIITNRHTIYKK